MNGTRKLVVFLNSHAYAGGAANTTRAQGLVEAIRLAGYDVREIRHETWLTPVLERRFADATAKLARIARALALGSVIGDLLDQLDAEPCAIVVLGTDIRFLHRARRWAARHQVPVIDDVIDWYEIGEGRTLSEKAMIALTNFWAMPFEAGKCDEVIVVSRTLGAYFRKRHVPQTLIPTLLSDGPDRSTISHGQRMPKSSDGPSLRLAYVGNPGLRDIGTISNLVSASRSDPEFAVPFVGTMPELTYRAEDLPVTIRQFGKLDRRSAVGIVEQADFTVLQRPADRRFARAGFPSKVAESLLCGTPVMVNLTSDLAEYIVERQNGIVLADDSLEALLDGIARARDWLASAVPPDRAAIAAAASRVFTPRAHAGDIQMILRRLTTRSDAVRV